LATCGQLYLARISHAIGLIARFLMRPPHGNWLNPDSGWPESLPFYVLVFVAMGVRRLELLSLVELAGERRAIAACLLRHEGLDGISGRPELFVRNGYISPCRGRHQPGRRDSG